MTPDSTTTFANAFDAGPLVIGHRGAAGLAPENTLPGFRRAWQLDVFAVELDVQLVDGVLIVLHDSTLDRTTNVRGPVTDLSLAELRMVDAGGGAAVPLLAEVVKELPTGSGLNIELKGARTAGPTAEFIAANPIRNLLVSSFDHAELRRFRELDQQTPVAPLFGRWQGDPWATAAQLNACAINLSRRIAAAPILEEACRRGLATWIYTVNDLAEAQRLVALGATGVFTDYPDRITRAALAGQTPA